MRKVTKKKQIEDLQTVVAAQWRQINKLKLHLGRLVDIDWSDEQASHDEVIAILDSKEPKLKQLDQSVFDGEPEQIRWAVVTSEGAVLKFELEPVVKDGLWSWAHGNGCRQHSLIGQYDANNWQNSLIERDKVELTGSDLCRAMLERGDRYVMCIVSEHGDAINIDSVIFPKVVYKSHGKCFMTTDSNWPYAIPINNQGEPLTAADVGL